MPELMSLAPMSKPNVSPELSLISINGWSTSPRSRAKPKSSCPNPLRVNVVLASNSKKSLSPIKSRTKSGKYCLISSKSMARGIS